MSEEQQSVSAGSAEVNTSAPAVVGDQQVPAQTTVPSSGSAAPATAAPQNTEDKEIWDGNPDSLPEQMRPRAKAMQRHLTLKTQEIAEVKKQADEYKRITSSPEWQAFQRFGQPAQNASVPPQQPQPTISPELLENLGIDPRLGTVIENAIQAKVQEKEALISQKFNELQTEQMKSAKRQEIEAFGNLNPKFWEYVDLGLAMPIIKHVVDEKGGSLEEAYAEMERYDTHYKNQALKASQARVQAKQGAVTPTPTTPVESEVVYVDSAEDTYAAAFEEAVSGRNRKVKVRRK